MRRAIRPATCTQVTSRPSRVCSHSALRSFSSDALSSAALTKAPGKYQRSFTVPSTGERLECTLKTFMNTLTLSASRCSHGSRDLLISTMRPSAGDTTAPGSSGTSRGGARKDLVTKSAASQIGTDHHQPRNTPISTPAATAMATNSQPSRAISGCGYGGFMRLLLVFLQALGPLPLLLHQVIDLFRDAVHGLFLLLADAFRPFGLGHLVAASGEHQYCTDKECAHG